MHGILNRFAPAYLQIEDITHVTCIFNHAISLKYIIEIIEVRVSWPEHRSY